MRLNMDCIRDIMLWVESITTPRKYACYVDTDMVEALQEIYLDESDKPTPSAEQKQLCIKYSNEVLVYHLNYCIEAGLLKLHNASSRERILIEDLTPLGHEFIANVREDANYNSIKSRAKKAGIETLQGMIDIGKSLAASALAKTLT